MKETAALPWMRSSDSVNLGSVFNFFHLDSAKTLLIVDISRLTDCVRQLHAVSSHVDGDGRRPEHSTGGIASDDEAI